MPGNALLDDRARTARSATRRRPPAASARARSGHRRRPRTGSPAGCPPRDRHSRGRGRARRTAAASARCRPPRRRSPSWSSDAHAATRGAAPRSSQRDDQRRVLHRDAALVVVAVERPGLDLAPGQLAAVQQAMERVQDVVALGADLRAAPPRAASALRAQRSASAVTGSAPCRHGPLPSRPARARRARGCRRAGPGWCC